MKKIAIILSITFPIFCSSQTIQFDDREVPYSIYMGFINTFKVLPAVGEDSNELNISCVNCQLEKIESTDKGYLVFNIKPENGFKQAQLRISDKNEVLLKEENFQISRLPAPDVFLGEIMNGGVFNKENLKLRVGYSPEVTLKFTIELVSWEVTIENRTYSGQSDNFTHEALMAINNIKKDQTLYVICNVKDDVTGIYRKLGAEFKSK
ncbi:MAG: hypothetical protein RI883_522 [Bacteroidota bacterium]|jgi:hypothetical protein